MVVNADKCHLLKSTSEKVAVKLENEIIRNSLLEKLLVVLIDKDDFPTSRAKSS